MKSLFYTDWLIDEPLMESCSDDAFASCNYIDSMLKAVEKSITRSLAKQVTKNS